MVKETREIKGTIHRIRKGEIEIKLAASKGGIRRILKLGPEPVDFPTLTGVSKNRLIFTVEDRPRNIIRLIGIKKSRTW